MLKRQRFLYSLLLAALVACLAPLPALGAEEKEELPNAIGEVTYIMGSVNAEQPDGKVRPLDLESQVIPLDMIKTGRDSNVEIRFKDDTVYAQGEMASISLDEYVYSPNPSMSKLLFKMGEGTFRFVTGEIVKQNPDNFELQTPLSTLGIRGTEPFAVVEKASEQIGVIAIDPKHVVEVKTARAKVTINKPGVMTTVSSDGSMTAPAPTPAKTQKNVIQSAPMPSQGELGSMGSKVDLQRKAKAFELNAIRQKGQLGGVGDKPNYGSLRNIHRQQAGQRNAEGEQAGTRSTTGSGTGDGGGGSSSSSSGSSGY